MTYNTTGTVSSRATAAADGKLTEWASGDRLLISRLFLYVCPWESHMLWGFWRVERVEGMFVVSAGQQLGAAAASCS